MMKLMLRDELSRMSSTMLVCKPCCVPAPMYLNITNIKHIQEIMQICTEKTPEKI